MSILDYERQALTYNEWSVLNLIANRCKIATRLFLTGGAFRGSTKLNTVDAMEEILDCIDVPENLENCRLTREQLRNLLATIVTWRQRYLGSKADLALESCITVLRKFK